MALARPPRIGELVVVERDLCGYEKGEVADIENVLAGERKEHNDRDFEMTEREQLEEAEQTAVREEVEESREESRMRVEAEQVLQTDTRFEASLNVVAQYPPYVTVTADAGFQLNNSRTQTDKAISGMAREVTSKTAKRVTDRELTRRTTRTRRERERRYRHRFEASDDSVIGVYRFVDAVWTARSVRYDPPRLQCELVLPEPAAWLKMALDSRPSVTIDMPMPTEPKNDTGGRLSPTDITVGNWSTLVAAAQATGVPPPPEPQVRVTRSVKSAQDPPPSGSGTSGGLLPRVEVRDTLNVPEGYQAVRYKVAFSALVGAVAPSPSFTVMVGDDDPRLTSAAAPYYNASVSGTLGGITDVVAFAIEHEVGYGFSAVVTVWCTLTGEALDRWESTVHSRIWATYQAAQELYESRLAEARARVADPPAGLRSTETRRLIETELRRLCLHMLAGGRFPRPDSVSLLTGPDLTPNIPVNAEERDRILFLEQAFDWRLIQYAPYPYYWGRHSEWPELALRDGPDAMLAEFERAGAVRVVVPAREGFNLALLHYLKKGRVWFGSRPPQMGDPLYLSIALEVADQLDRPREGTVLDTWRFRLPTPHLVLGSLPECPPLQEEPP